MRGKLGNAECVTGNAGITPAGAGKTGRKGLSTAQPRDHPRRCGENSALAAAAGVMPGSPPQVRGKRNLSVSADTSPWITPAGAGKTGGYRPKNPDGRDHPRRCGENVVHVAHVHAGGGSPPQVRGKLSSFGTVSAPCRITPAGAGKTSAGVPITAI